MRGLHDPAAAVHQTEVWLVFEVKHLLLESFGFEGFRAFRVFRVEGFRALGFGGFWGL